MSDSASAQVNAQKRRLIAARAIDESEKRMYVQVLSQGQILSNSSVFSKTRRGTPYNGLYGKAPPERGIYFRLQVYERQGLIVEAYERVKKSVTPVCRNTQNVLQMLFWAVIK